MAFEMSVLLKHPDFLSKGKINGLLLKAGTAKPIDLCSDNVTSSIHAYYYGSSKSNNILLQSS